MTKKFGFTLAEVLITLGIIGVVAAMTIPTLIANTNSAKFSSQFKKSLSTLGQAGLMAQAQYDLDYALADGKCSNSPASEKPDAQQSICAIFNATLSGATYVGKANTITTKDGKAYKIVGDANGLPLAEGGAPSSYYAYTLADGSMIAFNTDYAGCTIAIGTTAEQFLADEDNNTCIGFIDVNGVTPPNKVVSCGSGTTAKRTADNACGVPKDAAHTTDIYPVLFHDSTVEPATNAAMAVLSGRTSGSGSSGS